MARVQDGFINPILKKQLLYELDKYEYEPFHAVNDLVFLTDAPNKKQ